MTNIKIAVLRTKIHEKIDDISKAPQTDTCPKITLTSTDLPAKLPPFPIFSPSTSPAFRPSKSSSN